MRPAVWFDSKSKGILSEAGNIATLRLNSDGKARDCGIEDGSIKYEKIM